jgi:hypothetical protein
MLRLRLQHPARHLQIKAGTVSYRDGSVVVTGCVDDLQVLVVEGMVGIMNSNPQTVGLMAEVAGIHTCTPWFPTRSGRATADACLSATWIRTP